MSEILTKVVVDCSTGVTETLPLNAEEIAQYESDLETFRTQEAARVAAETARAALKASARAKLVAGQPLTEEEAATIVL